MVSSSTYWYSGGYCSGLSICVVLSCGIPLGCDRNYFDYFWFVKLDYGLEYMWKWFHMLQWTMDISYLMKWIFCKYLLRQFDIWCGFILKYLRRFLVCVADYPFFVSGSIHLSKFFTHWCLLYEIWIPQHVRHFWEKNPPFFHIADCLTNFDGFLLCWLLCSVEFEFNSNAPGHPLSDHRSIPAALPLLAFYLRMTELVRTLVTLLHVPLLRLEHLSGEPCSHFARSLGSSWLWY